MVTEEERQSIINEAVEKALLALPSVMGNLMAQQATYSKLTSKFYRDHPEFAKHKDIVASCIEKVDGQNPTLPFDEKLKKAEPEIQKQIEMLHSVSLDATKGTPNRTFGPLEAQRPTDHGEF